MKNIWQNFYRKIIFNASALYNMTFITMQCDYLFPKGGKFLKIRNILVKSKRRDK